VLGIPRPASLAGLATAMLRIVGLAERCWIKFRKDRVEFIYIDPPPPGVFEQITHDFENKVTYVIFEINDLLFITSEEYALIHLFKNHSLDDINKILNGLYSMFGQISIKHPTNIN